MKAVIVFDSVYGNTEKIARAIGAAIGGEVQVVRVTEAQASALQGLDLLIVGGPTQGARPRPELQAYLKQLPALNGLKVAAFDTRLTWRVLKIMGFAAAKIADALKGKGGTLVAPPEGFIVGGAAPSKLADGELERAAAWAQAIVKS